MGVGSPYVSSQCDGGGSIEVYIVVHTISGV